MSLRTLLRLYVSALALVSAGWLIPLCLMLALDTPLHTVPKYFAPHYTNADITMLLACFVGCVLILRLAVFFSGRYVPSPLTWAFVAVHAVEAVVIGHRFLVNMYPQRQMASNMRLQEDMIIALKLANPFIFLFLRTPARARRAIE
jgi:hypothetical protein